MADEPLIDQAYGRYSVLSKLIEMELERGRANPQDRRYQALGITDAGDTKKEAARKVAEAFDGLAKLVEHVAILDMAASFERFVKGCIGNSLGEARKALTGLAKQGRVSELAPKLVKNIEEFGGLRDIEILLEGLVSRQVFEVLTLIRDSRNKFAHGADLSVPPVVEPEQARDSLKKIASRIK